MTGNVDVNSFEFNSALTVQENLDLYFKHLNEIDSEMAKILQSHIEKLIPLPEGQNRTRARKDFAKALEKELSVFRSGELK